MKLEDIHSEIRKDIPIDSTDLGKESIRGANLFIKWRKIYDDEKLRIRNLEKQRDVLAIEKRDYYSGNAPAEVYKEKPFAKRIRAEGEMQKYISADPDIIKLDDQIYLQIQKIETIEAVLKELSQRTYQIKNAIEYLRFISGG